MYVLPAASVRLPKTEQLQEAGRKRLIPPFLLVLFPVVLVKYPDKSNRVEKESILAHNLKFVTAEKPRLQKLEAPSHSQFIVLRKKKMHLPPSTHTCLPAPQTVSVSISPGSSL